MWFMVHMTYASSSGSLSGTATGSLIETASSAALKGISALIRRIVTISLRMIDRVLRVSSLHRAAPPSSLCSFLRAKNLRFTHAFQSAVGRALGCDDFALQSQQSAHQASQSVRGCEKKRLNGQDLLEGRNLVKSHSNDSVISRIDSALNIEVHRRRQLDVSLKALWDISVDRIATLRTTITSAKNVSFRVFAFPRFLLQAHCSRDLVDCSCDCGFLPGSR